MPSFNYILTCIHVHVHLSMYGHIHCYSKYMYICCTLYTCLCMLTFFSPRISLENKFLSLLQTLLWSTVAIGYVCESPTVCSAANTAVGSSLLLACFKLGSRTIAIEKLNNVTDFYSSCCYQCTSHLLQTLSSYVYKE